MMSIISKEMMKTIEERERFDTKCVVLKWSYSKVQLRT